MKPSTLSIGVILLIGAAYALLALTGRDQDLTETQPADHVVDQAGAHESAESDMRTPAGLTADTTGHNPAALQPGESESNDRRSVSDEDLRWAREETIKEVTVAYSLMFKHLGLTESEYSAMIDFLVEVGMSGTHMPGYRPVPIDEADRRAGFAALIGEAKLAEFLVLEQNKAEYREAQGVANLLAANGVPLTDAKHDQLLEILKQVREREQPGAEPNAEAGTLEWVESKIAAMDEYERLVLELGPSVLSAAQMDLLYERYHSFWLQRAAHFERQKASRANDNPDDDVPLGYLPRR